MDKYEFNIKVEQIKKLVNKGDFETAMKIADTIDWRRVRNANLLSMIASVYEKNEEYQEAKDILLIAFERAPIGKRLLYKLTQLALKQGNIQEAESYYREFCELAGDDSRQDILRYLILKAKNAPVEQLIHSLESYTSTELDEKWLYELADLYHQAGMAEECVKTCDKIMLMFGLGQYVDRAMELKLQYAPLTKYQMDLVENRDKYEEKLRQVEQNSGNVAGASQEEFEEPSTQPAAAVSAALRETEPEPTQPASAFVSVQGIPDENVVIRRRDEPKAIPVPAPDPEFLRAAVSGTLPASALSAADASEELVSGISASFADTAAADVSPEERLAASVKEAEVEASLAEEMSKITIETQTEEPVRTQTRILENVKDLKKTDSVSDKTRILDDIRHIQAVRAAEEENPSDAAGAVKEASFHHMMAVARTPERGLEIAVAALKSAHRILDSRHPVAKITGERLNQRGVLASAEKLAGKDLIVENAGDLTDEMLEELNQLLAEDRSEMIIVLIDNPRQIEGIQKANPSLAGKFRAVTSEEEAEAFLKKSAQVSESEHMPKKSVRQDAVLRDEALQKTVSQKAAPQKPVPEKTDAEQEKVMDIDEFAQYCCHYASQIDCSITGKSMLALYERIEIMEEDGIALTKTAAEDLIEEAADRAEKPSLGKRITGLFSSKYDKEGLLILKEEHFI